MPTNTKRQPEADTLSVETVAGILGISTSHAHRQIRQTGKLGPLTPIRIGRRIVFGRPQVDAVLAGGEA